MKFVRAARRAKKVAPKSAALGGHRRKTPSSVIVPSMAFVTPSLHKVRH